MTRSIAILRTGLVSSVGSTAASSCAAIRAGVTNPTETRFIDMEGNWIVAHQVPLRQPWRGITRLVKLAAAAVHDCLSGLEHEEWRHLPLILCVAEPTRPGREPSLDELFDALGRELACDFSADSAIVPQGRAAFGAALVQARQLIDAGRCQAALIVGVDSLLSAATLRAYEAAGRLLGPRNSNGFIPGEGAAALLVGPPQAGPRLICQGVGLASETSHIDAEQPLRADGITSAIKTALSEAACEMHELDFRITDLSGEQYYFREAALALSRTLRVRKEEFDLWHPAEYIGEAGAIAGIATVVVAEAAFRKSYAPGRGVLCHAGNDAGQRAAAVMRYEAADG